MTDLRNKRQNICVFCSSSNALAPEYVAVAERLGTLLGERGHTLIYGGCTLGLMGAVATAAHKQGGKVVGIIPELIHGHGLANPHAHEMIVTPDIKVRKALMEERADAFIALPGGFGTLEEILQVISLKNLGYHAKPVIYINTKSFYDPLIAFFEETFRQKFAKPSARELYHIAADAESALDYIAAYQEPKLESKFSAAGHVEKQAGRG